MANSPEQLVGNQALLREVNERIAEIASSSAGDLPEFLCECSRKDCTETLAFSLPEYERIRSSPNLFVIAPGHECPEVDRVVETRHDSHLVEKTKHLELVLSWHRITPGASPTVWTGRRPPNTDSRFRFAARAPLGFDLEMKGLRARRRKRLLELDEVEERLKPFGRRYLGVRPIPLDALVGTDSRAGSFTRDFRPLHSFSRDRIRSLEAAFADGAFPPIVTVKLGETYFVIDGHHRAALARRSGADMIDADVTELIARVPLPAGADMLDVVLRQLERIFLEDSGLAEARPGVRIPVSRPAHYLELLENVQVHGYHRMRGFERVLDDSEIAADWYDSIYEPTLAAVDRLRLTRVYEGAPEGDLFIMLHRHRRDAFPRIGCPHLAQTVVSVIGDGGRRLRVPSRRGRSPA